MNDVLWLLIIVVLIVAIVKAPKPPTTVAEAQEPPARALAGDWRTMFALDLLAALGNSSPTQPMVDEVVRWTIAEDGSDGAWNRGNPLNTTQCTGRDTGACRDPVEATVQTLTNGLYNGVIAAMQANDPEAFKRALWNSPWAASHYGHGESWPK